MRRWIRKDSAGTVARGTLWWRRTRYVLGLLGLCAIATCPIAKRSCTANSRMREASDLVGYLGDRVAEVLAQTGKVPPQAAGPTPRPSCCDQGGMCPVDLAAWDVPPWRALAFSIDSPHRFSYEYLPDGRGDGPAAPNLSVKPRDYTDAKWQASVTDDDLRNTIILGGQKTGKSPIMPGNPDLKDKPEVVDGLVQIIRGFAKK